MDAGVLFGALDVGSARWGIGRDIREFLDSGLFGAVVLGMTFGLPIGALILIALRRWVAVVPLLIWLGLMAAWFLYYATDWWANPGQAAWLPAFLLILIGWIIVITAFARVLRRHTARRA